MVLLWTNLENIVQAPKDNDWDTNVSKKIKSNRDFYDVLFVGTSMAVTNINVEELYLKYGIASLSLGKPQQMTFLSYFSLQDALKFQNPKVVFFDVQSLFYTEETQKQWIAESADYVAHYTTDDIISPKIKYDAYKQLKELSDQSKVWDYFSVMFHNHSNWENLNKKNFRYIPGKDLILGSRSLIGCYENATQKEYVSIEDNTNDKDEIPEINKKYLKKMVDLCKENNIDLILVRSCGSLYWSWAQYNSVQELANKWGVEYLDLAIKENEIQFDWKTDSYDGNHHNLLGARKWTNYLGKYLLKNYEFSDRRKEKKYNVYENARYKYEDILNAMQSKYDLLNAVNLNQYLDTLLNMEKKDSAIFISVNTDASTNFSIQNSKLFNSLGLNTDLKEKYGYSYCAVLDDGKNVIEQCGKEKIELSGALLDDTPFELTSSGLMAGQNASIKINGIEQIQNGQGINIVVYNKKVEEILSSVYFDTYEEENPITARMLDGVRQNEVGVNIWK